MRILITGANGEIGKEIAYQLSKNKKYNLDLLINKKNNKKVKLPQTQLFYQNLLKPINLEIKPHVIIHCAAKHPNSKLGSDMKNIYNTNIKITKNLIKFANKSCAKKIFFLSSIAVYGRINKKIVYENSKIFKPNLYEKSKLLSEKLFYHKNNTFQTVCLRIPGVFTLNLKKNYPLIVKIFKKILNNENIHAFNLNEKFNNTIDVLEIVRFINFALKKKEIKGKIYNFSGSKPIKFIEVIKLMKKVSSSKSKIINEMSNNKSFVISNNKISKNIKFKPCSTKKIITRCCEYIIKKHYA